MTLDLAACSDGELAALTLAGRHTAFSEIMRRHRGPVYRMICGQIGDAEEALDLTQDCFVSAFQHLKSYDGGRSLRVWLTRIAINKSRDWIRHRRVRHILSFAWALPPDSIENIQDDAPGQDVAAADQAELARLRQAIARLPIALKEMLVLRTIEGLSQAETAAALAISEKAVETRLYRARTRLGAMLRII